MMHTKFTDLYSQKDNIILCIQTQTESERETHIVKEREIMKNLHQNGVTLCVGCK